MSSHELCACSNDNINGRELSQINELVLQMDAGGIMMQRGLRSIEIVLR